MVKWAKNMQDDTHATIKNSMYSIVGYILPIIFTVIITPIIVNKLGVKEYGIMVFITAIMSLLSLIDGGITTSTVKRLAEYIGQKNQHKAKELMGTANSLFLIIGAIGVILVGIVIAILFIFFRQQIDNNPHVLIIICIVTLGFLVNSMNSLYTLIPSALQRFDISIKISTTVMILTSLSNLAAVLIFGNLISLFCSQLLISLIFVLIWRHNSLKLLPIATYSFGWSKEEVKKSVTFSFYTIINEISRTALFSLDRIIMPALIGTTSLSYYALAGNMTARIPGVADNLSGVVFPISAHLKGQDSHARMQTLYIRSTRLINLISSAIAVALIANSFEILKYWINEDVARNAWIAMIILAVTNLILSLLSPVATFFMVLEKWKTYTSLSAIMAVINIALIFLLIPHFGINGAAVAYLLSVVPIFYGIYKLEKKYLQIPSRIHFHIKQFLSMLVTALIFAAINYIAIKPLITGLPSLIILGPLSVLLYMLIYYALGFIPKEDVHDIKRVIRKKIPWIQNQN